MLPGQRGGEQNCSLVCNITGQCCVYRNKQTNRTNYDIPSMWTLRLTLKSFSSHGKMKAGTHTTNKQTNKQTNKLQYYYS